MMLKQVFSDGTKYVASRLVVALLFFVSVPLIIGVFGLDVYGAYSQQVALAGAISAICHSAVYQSYLRYGKDDIAFGGALGVLVGVSFALYIIYFVSTYWGLFQLDMGFTIISLSVSIGIYQIFRVHLQLNRWIRLYSIAEFSRALVMIVTPFVLLLEFSMNGERGLMVGFLIGNVLYILIVVLSGRSRSTNLDEAKFPLGRVVTYGGPLALWLSVAGAMNFLDRTIAIRLYDSDLAGSFAAYADLYNRAGALVIIPLSTAIIPVFISGSHSERIFSQGVYFVVLFSVAICMSGVATAVIFGYSMLNPNISIVIFDQFHTFIFLTGLSLWQISILTHKSLELSGRTGYMVLVILISSAFHYGVFFVFGDTLSSNFDFFAYAYFVSGFVYTFLTYLIVSYLNRKELVES